MPQKTLVIELPAKLGAALEKRLAAGAFSFRATPHALFSAQGEGVVATHYRSGKLVIQGEHPEVFAASYLGAVDVAPAKPQRTGREQPASDAETMIGSDESGKGDYFGPLVVAAVRLDAELAGKLAGGEVRDCKLMSDDSVMRVGAALRANVPHAIARLDPPAYNAEHARVRNLNPMLAGLHAQAIRELASPGMYVVVDQFAKEAVLLKALDGLEIRLEQRVRGEEILAVAAASVIAREQFLLALHELSEEFAIDLAKGAGPPVDKAARQFVALHGREKLGCVAKLHFKNSLKLPGGGAR